MTKPVNTAGFPAKYAGTCDTCRGPIKPGEVIAFSGALRGGGRQLYSHVECPPTVTAVRTVGDGKRSVAGTVNVRNGEVVITNLGPYQRIMRDAAPEWFYEDGESPDGVSEKQARKWVLENADYCVEVGALDPRDPPCEEASSLYAEVLALGKGFPRLITLDGVMLRRGEPKLDAENEVLGYTYYTTRGKATPVLFVAND